MDFLNDPSKRRLLVVLMTGLLGSLQQKLGISQDTLNLLIELAMVYVGMSNVKDAVVKRAEAAGKSAASGVSQDAMRQLILAAIADEKSKQAAEASAPEVKP